MQTQTQREAVRKKYGEQNGTGKPEVARSKK
jgi:hypothetical protein